MMAYTGDPSMGEMQAGRWRIPDLPKEPEAPLSHIVRLRLKKRTENELTK